MFEIFEAKVGFKPRRYIRWTDQCAGQFRSQFVVNNLFHIRDICPDLESATFKYFESHEGKNVSDLIGAMAKQSFARSISRSSNLLDGLGNNDDDADQEMVVAEQIKERMLSGLTFEDGKVGGFSFFQ